MLPKGVDALNPIFCTGHITSQFSTSSSALTQWYVHQNLCPFGRGRRGFQCRLGSLHRPEECPPDQVVSQRGPLSLGSTVNLMVGSVFSLPTLLPFSLCWEETGRRPSPACTDDAECVWVNISLKMSAMLPLES